MLKKIIISTTTISFLSFVYAGIGLAENAEVLPKGVFNANIDTKVYFPINEQYNEDGDVEDAAADFNSTLDTNIFTSLSLVEAGFGMEPGSANLGDSVVSFEYDATSVDLLFAYGLTDKTTIGIELPYTWIKNTVESRLETTDSTVGLNPYYESSGDPFGGSPFVPIALGGQKLTTENIIDLLSQGIDINKAGTIDIPGYRYKRFGTWRDKGIGDLKVGIKHQYFKSDTWRLAVTGGIQFPTGEVDDPDNLADRPFGSGAYALLFRLHNDYIAIKDLVLSASIGYDWYLSTDEDLRILSDPNEPLSRIKENVDIDPGDVIELETSVAYTFTEQWKASLLYMYGHGFKDKVSGGSLPISYDGLEDQSDYTEHVAAAGISYSTFQLFRDGKFPLPMSASLRYRNRFAGTNDVLKSEYIAFELRFFF